MSSPASFTKLVLTFLGRAFLPFAGICVRRGIKIQDAIEALKAAFVKASHEELELGGSKITASKLSVMTGLQRRDIARLLSGDGAVRRERSLLAKVIGQWRYDRRFSSKQQPRHLAFEGEHSEFMRLVESVSTDLNPYTVLFELERLGAVRRHEGKLVLAAESYEPTGDAQEGLRLLAEDVGDLSSAVEENIFAREDVPNLHIKTEYDNISVEHLDEIRRWLVQRGAEFHEEARAYLSKFDKDFNARLKDKPGGGRVMIGSFSITCSAGNKGKAK